MSSVPALVSTVEPQLRSRARRWGTAIRRANRALDVRVLVVLDPVRDLVGLVAVLRGWRGDVWLPLPQDEPTKGAAAEVAKVLARWRGV